MQGLRRCSNEIFSLDLTPPNTTTITDMGNSNSNNSNSTSSSSLSIDGGESTETRIQRLISEHPVIIFSRSSCCMCHAMKKLLLTIGVHPTVIELEDHEISALPPVPAAHQGDSSPRTLAVPSVFIGGNCVGGLESLVGLHLSGHLVPKLVEVGALWMVKCWESGKGFHLKLKTKTRTNLSPCRETLCKECVMAWHGLHFQCNYPDRLILASSYCGLLLPTLTISAWVNIFWFLQ